MNRKNIYNKAINLLNKQIRTHEKICPERKLWKNTAGSASEAFAATDLKKALNEAAAFGKGRLEQWEPCCSVNKSNRQNQGVSCTVIKKLHH